MSRSGSRLCRLLLKVAHVTSQDPIVSSGELTALRLIDIAYTIDLVQAQTLWASRASSAFSRSYLTSTPPKAVAFGVAPLWLAPLPL